MVNIGTFNKVGESYIGKLEMRTVGCAIPASCNKNFTFTLGTQRLI